MKKIDKKRIIIPVVMAVVLLGGYIALYLTASMKMNKTVTRSMVHTFLSGKLNLAIEYDSLKLGYDFNIKINNIRISYTGDFNDGTNLLSGGVITLVTSKSKLIQGMFHIESANLEDVSILVSKKFIDTGRITEIYNQVVDLLENIQKKARSISVTLEDITLLYQRGGSSETITDIVTINGLLSSKRANLVDINLTGIAKKKLLSQGSISCRGKWNTSQHSLKLNLTMDKVPLCKVKPLISNDESLILKGMLTGKGSLDINKKKISFKGDVKSRKVILKIAHSHGPSIANGSLDIAGDVAITPGESILIKEFQLKDKNHDIRGSLHLKGKNWLEMKLDTGDLNLDLISQWLHMTPNGKMTGSVKVKGEYAGVLWPMDPEAVSLSVKGDGLGYTEYTSNNRKLVINNSKINLSLDKKNFLFSLYSSFYQSDIKIDGRGTINRWQPFSSESTITGRSNNFQLKYLYEPVKIFLEYLFEEAIRDSKKGYEFTNFSTTPIGRFFNNNKIDGNYTARRLYLGKKSFCSDLSFDLSLNRGRAFLNNFRLQGYDGIFQLSMMALMERPIPFFQVDFSVDNFDLAKLYSDEKILPMSQGILQIKNIYKLSGYRPSYLFQNSDGELFIRVTGGILEKNLFMDELQEKLASRLEFKADLSKIPFSELSYSLIQRGENFWVKPFSFKSDSLVINGAGTYDYSEGYDIYVPLVVSAQGKYGYYKGSVTGPILHPSLFLKQRKGEPLEIPLFDIH